MNNFFIVIGFLLYTVWLIIFWVKLKKIDLKLPKKINFIVKTIYTEIISFKKSKYYVKNLQGNLNRQLDNIICKVKNKKDEKLWEYLDCLKDTVDLGDMTFYVGNDKVNIFLRYKVRECYSKNIMLDVVADIPEINIDQRHLFLVFSDIIDFAIKYIQDNCKTVKSNKIIIRASQKSLNNSSFFVLQIAYSLFGKKIQGYYIDDYIDKNYKEMVEVLTNYDNGTIVSKIKENRIINTINIPIIV